MTIEIIKIIASFILTVAFFYVYRKVGRQKGNNMIDEKKIETLAKETFANVRNSKDNVCMKVDFLSCVNWFKEAIWHKREEEPERHKRFLIQWTNKGISYCETGTIERKYDWQIIVMTYDDVRWCYIDDILPKGGDK